MILLFGKNPRVKEDFVFDFTNLGDFLATLFVPVIFPFLGALVILPVCFPILYVLKRWNLNSNQTLLICILAFVLLTNLLIIIYGFIWSRLFLINFLFKTTAGLLTFPAFSIAVIIATYAWGKNYFNPLPKNVN